MRTFSTVLEEYLDERDRQNSDYYANRPIDEQYQNGLYMDDLKDELDAMFEKLNTDIRQLQQDGLK